MQRKPEEQENSEDPDRQVQDDLADTSTLFGLMFRNNPLPMWFFDLRTLEFIEVNRAAVLHYGYSREEFLRMRITDIRPPEQVSNLLAHLDTLTAGNRGVFEGQHVKKNGEIIDVEVTGLTMREHIRFVLVQDVTGRKRAQDQLGLMAAIVESSEDAIIGKDLDGVIISWNPSAERMYGYKAEELVGKSVGIIFPPDRKDELAEIMSKIKRGERIVYYDTMRMRKDGTYLRISLAVSPTRDRDGKITGASAVARDITERYELDRRKNEFLSLASHELRTPVAVIRGFSQVALKIAEKLGDSRLIYALQGIHDNTTHIMRLVNDLLDASRIERAALPIYPVDVDLGRLIRQALNDIELTTPDLICTLDIPSEPVMVKADPQLVRQVVNNLVENAVKYSRDEPRIEVKMALSGDQALTSVSDFGIGIPEGDRAHIFERFYRAGNVGSRSRNGLGLGLFITRDIVQRHGGQIWLESAPDGGSTFYFTLPALK
jgi:PAS domain S-box-containing protein